MGILDISELIFSVIFILLEGNKIESVILSVIIVLFVFWISEIEELDKELSVGYELGKVSDEKELCLSVGLSDIFKILLLSGVSLPLLSVFSNFLKPDIVFVFKYEFIKSPGISDILVP